MANDQRFPSTSHAVGPQSSGGEYSSSSYGHIASISHERKIDDTEASPIKHPPSSRRDRDRLLRRYSTERYDGQSGAKRAEHCVTLIPSSGREPIARQGQLASSKKAG